MAKKRAANSKREAKVRIALESQDDVAYLTGQHSEEEQQKQVKSPTPRRAGDARTRSEAKEEDDGSGQKED